MKIGIDARLNGYRGGGIAEYTRHLLQALAELDTTNDYRVLQAWRDPVSLACGPNFRRVNTFTPCHHRLECTLLSIEISRLGLDIVHSPDFIPPRFGARRKVITIHDLNFLLYPQFQTPDSLRYYADQIKAAVRKADHILAVSEATKNDLIKLLSVPPTKITVQPEGVDPAFRPLPESILNETRQRLGLPSHYLLFVGTFEPRKNIPGLLAAYKNLLATMPDAPPLVLAGRRGWLYEPIFQAATDLGLEPYSYWMENVTYADLPAVYNSAAALVFPSFYEGFGLPALEAMACGVPTLVSNRGSLPELLGDSGIIVDLDQPEALVEGLRQVLTNPPPREAGLTRAGLFTWQRTAQIALDVYRGLIN